MLLRTLPVVPCGSPYEVESITRIPEKSLERTPGENTHMELLGKSPEGNPGEIPEKNHLKDSPDSRKISRRIPQVGMLGNPEKEFQKKS